LGEDNYGAGCSNSIALPLRRTLQHLEFLSAAFLQTQGFLLNSDKNVQECDATKVEYRVEDDSIIIFLHLQAIPKIFGITRITHH
jgi:hypothetical protein